MTAGSACPVGDSAGTGSRRDLRAHSAPAAGDAVHRARSAAPGSTGPGGSADRRRDGRAARAAGRRLLASSTRPASARLTTKACPRPRSGPRSTPAAPRRSDAEIVDTKAGYVYDGTRLESVASRLGIAAGTRQGQVYSYPDCKDGRVVADVVRLDKGHTEGLEPKVTEELIKLMLSAKGGKLQQAPSPPSQPSGAN